MINLRPYQEEALDCIWHYFANGNVGNPLIAWPTGTGKSCIPAVFIERIMKVWPTQQVMMITHVKELIEQNAQVLEMIWSNAPLGIFSAGLKKKDIALPIIYAGIQSAIKNPLVFGHRDIVFIDEGHLVNQDESSMYLTFINALKIINPNLKIIGMTATPFRMGQGLLTDGGLFTDIIHDLTGIEGFNRLIAEGYLCPLVPLRTKTEIDVSTVGMAKGEFILSQLEDAADKEKITYEGIKELVNTGHDRKSWLIFSSGIKHAEHIATMLSSFGIECAAVHSKQKAEYNDNAIKAFKRGELRSIVNFSKLTTGFNHPDIDLIGDFRPTMSIPLHIQKLGRGTRPAVNKHNCLVLDFGRNVPRLGPINDPIIPRRKGEKQGDIPIKLCDNCGAYNHISARICCQCGEEFSFQIKLVAKPGTDAILRSDLPIIEQFNVDRVIYDQHNKIGSPPSMKVTYFCGLQAFKEWICLEHPGMAGKVARDWWRKRTGLPSAPLTTQAALTQLSHLQVPKRIKVWCNKKYPEIIGAEF